MKTIHLNLLACLFWEFPSKIPYGSEDSRLFSFILSEWDSLKWLKCLRTRSVTMDLRVVPWGFYWLWEAKLVFPKYVKKQDFVPYVKTAQSNQEKWRMCPHKNLLLNVHSIIHSNQKVETIQMPINWWTDKQNLVCPYKEILFDNKRNEVMIQAVTWMTFKTLYQVKKIPHYMIAFIWNVEKRQIHGVKNAN